MTDRAYHVVCHTCANAGTEKHEGVYGTEAEANGVVEDHRSRGHDVELLELVP